jgi:zinc D-Ala-D-Ala carboxypeptidase
MKYFKLSEFDCKETGNNKMQPEFLELIDKLREACGFPFIINSGYRDPTHSIEAKKSKPGTHAQGIAADIRVSNGSQAYVLQKNAYALGFTGIALGNGFVHVDIRKTTPVSWRY